MMRDRSTADLPNDALNELLTGRAGPAVGWEDQRSARVGRVAGWDDDEAGLDVPGLSLVAV